MSIHTHDPNIFVHMNSSRRMEPMRRTGCCPADFGYSPAAPRGQFYRNPDNLQSPQAGLEISEKGDEPRGGGDQSLHYRMLRKGLLTNVPTFRRRIYTDLDPLTRIEESIPRTREERQQAKLVQGVIKIAKVLNNFMGQPASYSDKVKASQTALRALLENHNVPMGGVMNELIDQMTPAQVKHVLDDVKSELEHGEIDASEAQIIIKAAIKKEAEGDEHKHDEYDESTIRAHAGLPPLTPEEKSDADTPYERAVRDKVSSGRLAITNKMVKLGGDNRDVFRVTTPHPLTGRSRGHVWIDDSGDEQYAPPIRIFTRG